MPYTNGLIAVVLIAIATALVVELFDINNPINVVFMSGLLVAAPSIGTEFGYTYMMDGFAVCILLVSAGVYLSRKYDKWGFVFSGALLCLSLGIYQSYFNYAVALYAGLIFFIIFDKEVKTKDIIIRAVKDVGALVLGLGLYFVVTKVLLALTPQELAPYQGIESMGTDTIANFFTNIVVAYKSFALYNVNSDS